MSGGAGLGVEDREEKAGPRRDDPKIPEGITGAELDRGVKAELRSLPRTLADLVAQHLVASGRFLDDDPELAYQHARVARRLASRLWREYVEAVAITAYLAEHYDEALTEFRAVRRMTGNHEVIAMMADCERALGRPDKALALTKDKHVQRAVGGDADRAADRRGRAHDVTWVRPRRRSRRSTVPELTKRTRAANWLPRLRLRVRRRAGGGGRTDEALVWFHRAAGVDGDGLTGAAERAAQLEGHRVHRPRRRRHRSRREYFEEEDEVEEDDDEDLADEADLDDTEDEAQDADDESEDEVDESCRRGVKLLTRPTTS
jgi:hypothetical protein